MYGASLGIFKVDIIHPEQNLNMADVWFQQPDVVISWPWIEISVRNLIRK